MPNGGFRRGRYSNLYSVLLDYNMHFLQLINNHLRSWLKVANDEKNSRGPDYFIRIVKETKSLSNFEMIKKDLTEYCRKKPSLNIFYFLNLVELERPSSCQCENLSLNSYILEISYFCNIQNQKTIFSLFFPEETNIQISMVTFKQFIPFGKIYCEEAKIWFDSSLFNTERIKSIFEPFFNNNRPTTSCLIIFCECNCTIAKFLEMALKSWFPNKNIPVWGGKIFNLSVCSYLSNSRKCKDNPHCAAVLINGTEMETYSICIDSNIDTQLDIENKLKILKVNIELKKHSIGFMFSSKVISKLYNLQLNTFKQLFPEMTLITYFGSEAYGGNKDG
ncbi:hypothetical protein M0804_002619 [Polistes exclamans]|nr:hypothetical protein M0804_002619 [Polistes exclamans]